MRYVEFMKRVVPMHNDLFDFFYQALPGYEEVGRRRADMVCWGSLNDPEHCDFRYDHMTDWGRKMFVSPGVIRDGQLLTNDLVEINLGIRILLGSSYYEDWEDQEMFVTRDPLGNPVDRRHPWNQHTIPRPAKRDFGDKYSWVMSPRCGPATRRPGSRSPCRTRPTAAGSPRRCAACCRTIWSSGTGRSPTTTRTHRPRGTPASVTPAARPAPTRTRCRIRRSSRRTRRTSSRASTSCARSAATTRACRAGCTCISATARCWRRCTRR